MKFNTAIPATIFATLLSAQEGQARKGGGGNRPFAGGPFGKIPGFPGDQVRPNITSISCDASFECETRKGDVGTFVCRKTYNPITGWEREEAKCIPTDKAWEDVDVCGCCGDDCPVQPDFVNITCPDPTERRLQFGGGRGQGGRGQGGRGQGGRGQGGRGQGGRGNRVAVCRELYNPFTGDKANATIPIRADRALDGDTCGCCDGVCPEKGTPVFARPDEVELDWCAADALTNCTIPRKKGRGGIFGGDEEDREGVFVCRSMVNMVTGVAESQPLCISPDRAFETDGCGCCGIDCPSQPLLADINCSEPADECQTKGGDDGVFVCRSLFHPLDGSVVEASLCIPTEKTWATDQCGCCGSGCPGTPEGGFDTEDVQLMMLAAGETESGTAASGAFQFSSSFFLIGLVATAFFGL